MKTLTDLFLAFTQNRKPTIENGDNVNFANAKFYFISQKQASWLSSLIFNHANNLNAYINSVNQYQHSIGNNTYTLISGKRTHRIRVS